MSGVRRRSLFLALGVVAVQAGAYGVYRLIEQRRQARPSGATFSMDPISGVAPDIELVRADGRKLRLSELKGDVVVVHFWATWCEPCARELPSLLEFAERIVASGVQILAVSLDDGWSHVRTFLQADVPPHVVRGATGSEGKAYGVGALPHTFVIDPRGELVLHALGPRDWTSVRAADVMLALRSDGASHE